MVEPRELFRLAKDALVTEGMSVAGRINIVGMAMVFCLLAVDGTLDLIQTIVRIWHPAFTAGNPPILLLASVMFSLTLCCIVAVTIIDPLYLSRRRYELRRVSQDSSQATADTHDQP
jgi:hypothetical protein